MARLTLPWGEAADPEDLDALLSREPDITTVLITHNETSTGVTNPLETLAAVVKRHNRLLVVDGVSSIGSIALPVDAWGVDVAITASQKGWMLPPGVTMLSVSKAAWQRQQSPALLPASRRARLCDRDSNHSTETRASLNKLYTLLVRLQAAIHR